MLIRSAFAEDMNRVHELITELAVFEKEPDAVLVSPDDLVRDGFGDNPRFTCFVAEVNDRIQGIALVYERYSTWDGPALHLEDLIVTQKMRGKGIGNALLKKVVEFGAELGVRRISWEVLDWNEPAIRFYEGKGATILRDWNVVQLNEIGIRKFLAA